MVLLSCKFFSYSVILSILVASSRKPSLTVPPGLSGLPGIGRPHFLSPCPSVAQQSCQPLAQGVIPTTEKALRTEVSGEPVLQPVYSHSWALLPSRDFRVGWPGGLSTHSSLGSIHSPRPYSMSSRLLFVNPGTQMEVGGVERRPKGVTSSRRKREDDHTPIRGGKVYLEEL